MTLLYRIVNTHDSHGRWRTWEDLLALIARFRANGNLDLIDRVEAVDSADVWR